MAEIQSNEKNNNIAELISDLFVSCLNNWKLFVISFVVIVGFKVFSLIKEEPLYQRSATILIKEESSGGQLGNMAASLGELGGFAASSNVDNELEAIKSPAVTEKLVEKLDLNINYIRKKSIKEITLYGSNQPFIIKFPDAKENMTYSVEGIMTDEKSFVIKKLTSNINKKETEYSGLNYSVNLQQTSCIETEIGRIEISPNEKYKTGLYADEDVKIEVTWESIKSSIEKYNEKLRAELANRRASVINISILDSSVERAEDILNTVIDVYNQYWIDDKNQITITTAQFINQRLDLIEQELMNVDKDISSYKSKNALPDLETRIKTDIIRQSESDSRIIELQSQLTMAQSLQEYVKDTNNFSNVLPALNITGLQGGDALNVEIAEYNKTLMERNRLFQTTSAKNPIVMDYDSRLSSMRIAISNSLTHQVEQIQTALNDQVADRNKTNVRIAQGPSQANDLLGIERQQKVKESLYLYLLEKREENELSQAFTAYNTRVLTPPMGSLKPVSPRVISSLAIAIFCAIMLPLAYIYIKVTLDTLVRSREDIDTRVKAPFLGSVPFHGKKPSKISRILHRKKQEDTASEIVVKRGNGSPVNEAFRMIRSNLELMNSRLLARQEGKSIVTMVTSAIPGSGKTFVSLNLAAAYALKNVKVVLVDVDLRKATLSKSFGAPHRGVTSYLSGTSTLDEITIKNASGMDNLDVVPAGAIPPDPAEMIDSPQFVKMIEELKERYDVVLLDCPPTEPVTDSLVITRSADRTVYVVRVGNLKRTFLSTIQEYYENKRYINMTLVLNAVEGNMKQSYGYGYGYGYAENSR